MNQLGQRRRGFVVLFLLGSLAPPSVALAQPQYTYERLPDDMVPFAINNRGDVAGYDQARWRAMVRLNGAIIDLARGWVSDINDHQHVVGDMVIAGVGAVQLWSPQMGFVALPVHRDGWYPMPLSINNHGAIVGFIFPPDCPADCEEPWVGVMWARGTHEITILPGFRASPTQINDVGIIVGLSGRRNTGEPWSGRSMAR